MENKHESNGGILFGDGARDFFDARAAAFDSISALRSTVRVYVELLREDGVALETIASRVTATFARAREALGPDVSGTEHAKDFILPDRLTQWCAEFYHGRDTTAS